MHAFICAHVRACLCACVRACLCACVNNISVDNNPEVTGCLEEIALVLYIKVITTTFYRL